MSRSPTAAKLTRSFPCPFCKSTEWETEPAGMIRCAYCHQTFSDASFQAHGADAMDAQTTIVTEHIRAYSQVKMTQNILAAAFVITSGLCVLFAPTGREVAAEIVAVAFLVLGAGIAGFANLRVRAPHVELTASGQQLPVTRREKSKAGATNERPPTHNS
jgi:ribosomal protein L37AE/L43A